MDIFLDETRLSCTVHSVVPYQPELSQANAPAQVLVLLHRELDP